MRIKEGFKMRPLLKEHIVMAEGGNVNFNKIISLNPTAAYLWEKIAGKEFDEPELVEMLLDEYEVERNVAEADVAKFVTSLRESGLLED